MSTEVKDCNNCKHKALSINDFPCDVCEYRDIQDLPPTHWEYKGPGPISIKDCSTCANAVTEKGCCSCYGFNLWEEAQDLNTYEVSLQGKQRIQIKAHSKFGVQQLLGQGIIEIKEIKS